MKYLKLKSIYLFCMKDEAQVLNITFNYSFCDVHTMAIHGQVVHRVGGLTCHTAHSLSFLPSCLALPL